MSGRYKSFVFLFIFTLTTTTVSRADITLSASQSSNTPFPFTIKPYAYDPDRHSFFVGASQDPTGDFRKASISFVTPLTTYFTGITPEKTTLDGVSNQPNPLYGQTIDFLTLISSTTNTDYPSSAPLVVSHAENKKVYALPNFVNDTTVVSSAELQDFANLTCGGIVALQGASNGNAFLAAVTPNAGTNFGTPNSALVLGILTIPTDTVKKYVITLSSKGAVGVDSPALKITNDLTSIAPTPVNIYASRRLNDYYIGGFYTGLCVQTNGILGSGARCIILGLNNQIAPDAAITNDSIIGGRTVVAGTPVTVCAHQLAVMYTSTSLLYLIMVGGVGTPTTTTNNVYALPLVGVGELAGTLAQKNSLPTDVYYTSKSTILLNRLTTRAFLTPATQPGDLFSPTDADIYRAQVGGNDPALLPGDISSIYVEKDTVFATIATDGINQPGGIFASQAIFDANGRIMGFTNWRRASGAQEPVVASVLDNTLGDFTFLPGNDPNNLHTVKRTLWGTSTFYQNLEALFKDPNNPNLNLATGAQYIADFPQKNAAFNQIAGNRLSLLCATGYRCLALVQSGSDSGVLFKAATDLQSIFSSTDGSTTGFGGTADGLFFSGGTLENLGALIAADILHTAATATSNWLFVGGNGGLAVLAAADGSGLPLLNKNFTNLPTTLSFRAMGSLRNVRKIIATATALYVLTTDQLVRFDATHPLFPLGAPATVLASLDSIPQEVGTFTSFSDVAISGPVALLAGDDGLLRVGNNRSIATATSSLDLAWKRVVLPESAGPVTRLFVVSATGNDTDFATDVRGGNIYALSACISLHQSYIYRIAITGNTTVVLPTTVLLFADHFYKDVNPSFFYSRGDYRNFTATDGALIFMSRSYYYPFRMDGLLETLNSKLRTGRPSMFDVPPARLVSSNAPTMGPIIRRSASGSWMVGGGHLYAND